MKAVANGECMYVRFGCSELTGLVGVGEAVMLGIMASQDDNRWQDDFLRRRSGQDLVIAHLFANSMSMNPRHAAAVALVGWYLMVPPIVRPSGREGTTDTNAPLSKWVKVIRGTFDSDDACYVALRRFQFAVQSNYQSAAPEALTESEFQSIRQASSAKCIASRLTAHGKVV